MALNRGALLSGRSMLAACLGARACAAGAMIPRAASPPQQRPPVLAKRATGVLNAHTIRTIRRYSSRVDLPKVSIELLGLRVVGVSYYGLVDPLFRNQLQRGDPAVVLPEPDNKYDANAIAVHVRGTHIGYVPRELQGVVEPYLGEGSWVLATVGAFRPNAEGAAAAAADDDGDGDGDGDPTLPQRGDSTTATIDEIDVDAERTLLATRLTEHGLSDYLDLLWNHAVTLATGSSVTDDALVAIGVGRKIHRRRIVAALAEPEKRGGDRVVPFATLCHVQYWGDG